MIKRDGSIKYQRSCLFDQKGESGDTEREREKASPDDQTDMMRDQTRTRTIGNKRA